MAAMNGMRNAKRNERGCPAAVVAMALAETTVTAVTIIIQTAINLFVAFRQVNVAVMASRACISFSPCNLLVWQSEMWYKRGAPLRHILQPWNRVATHIANIRIIQFSAESVGLLSAFLIVVVFVVIVDGESNVCLRKWQRWIINVSTFFFSFHSPAAMLLVPVRKIVQCNGASSQWHTNSHSCTVAVVHTRPLLFNKQSIFIR